MGLNRVKLGSLISVVDERNISGLNNFTGINIEKEFMPTAASTDNLDSTKYKVVRKNRFVFSGMQTGRDGCIRITMLENEQPVIVSPAYTTFEISGKQKVLPEYFFMLFLSSEMDRLGWFYSDGSIRANLDWDRFCDIEIDLPPIDIQQKYVNIYKAMQANQKAYEKGLEDLKLVCDGYIEDLRRKLPCEEIGKYIEETNEKNSDNAIKNVVGLSTQKEMIQTKADLDGVKLSSYKLFPSNHLAYVPDTSRRGDKISLAYNDTENTYLVSSISIVFYVKDTENLLPDFLFMYFNRPEFDRYSRFNSWGSARENFIFEEMKHVKIPIPDIKVQQSIANIYSVYIKRKEINQKLKDQLKAVCPVLVKGAMDEGRKGVAGR